MEKKELIEENQRLKEELERYKGRINYPNCMICNKPVNLSEGKLTILENVITDYKNKRETLGHIHKKCWEEKLHPV